MTFHGIPYDRIVESVQVFATQKANVILNKYYELKAKTDNPEQQADFKNAERELNKLVRRTKQPNFINYIIQSSQSQVK